MIDHTNVGLAITRGRILWNGEFYTGTIKQVNDTLSEIYLTSYKDGYEDGEYVATKTNGQILERRYFKKGIKHGIHRSWYENGKNRLYSEFDEGKYINDRWEWYENGKPYIYEKYNQDGKILASKVWNRQGQIYMNLAFTNTGSSLGMPGSKICEPIKPFDPKTLYPK